MSIHASDNTRPVTGPDGDNPITDEQIRELLAVAIENRGAFGLRRREIMRDCREALGEWSDVITPDPQPAARARCAAAWNARPEGGR